MKNLCLIFLVGLSLKAFSAVVQSPDDEKSLFVEYTDEMNDTKIYISKKSKAYSVYNSEGVHLMPAIFVKEKNVSIVTYLNLKTSKMVFSPSLLKIKCVGGVINKVKVSPVSNLKSSSDLSCGTENCTHSNSIAISIASDVFKKITECKTKLLLEVNGLNSNADGKIDNSSEAEAWFFEGVKNTLDKYNEIKKSK